MTDGLIVIMPCCRGGQQQGRLEHVLGFALEGIPHQMITDMQKLSPQKGKKLLFVISLPESGINMDYYTLLEHIRLNPHFFEDCVGGVIVDGVTELYTKAIGRELVFSANCSGCTFPGRPLVEATGSMSNFDIIARNLETDCIGAYRQSARLLVERLLDFRQPKHLDPRLLVLHASNRATSNTLALWSMVKEQLPPWKIREVGLQNGAVVDCRGCSYKTCLHYGEANQCFYGGVVVDEVYPAINESQALMLLCPNYNDSVSANISAFINRLTALFRKQGFYEKTVFAVIVSGYSGGDILARQLISGLNMNKNFILPAGFALMETANDPGSIVKHRMEIAGAAQEFAKRMIRTLQA